MPADFVYPKESQFRPWRDPQDPSNRSRPQTAPPKTVEIVVGRQDSPEKRPPANKLRVTTKRHIGPLVPVIPDDDPVLSVERDASGDGSRTLNVDDREENVGDSSDTEEPDDVDMGGSDSEQPIDSKGDPPGQANNKTPVKAAPQPPKEKFQVTKKVIQKLTGGKNKKQGKRENT